MKQMRSLANKQSSIRRGDTMSLFFPGEYLDSTYVIDFDKLYKDGYRAVIFDVDNTLVPHDEPADERAKALFAHLKELGSVSYTHLTLPTTAHSCRSRWSPYH